MPESRFAPPPRLLVVNADDFGLSPAVNRGIIEAHLHGPVTSASLMSNLPSAAAAVELARAAPELGLGLHLNLTAGRPLTPPERVPSLVDRRGRFWVLGQFLLRLTAGAINPVELERELSAQFELALALGVRLDHLDGHHHIQIHPRLAPLILRLARRFGVPALRAPAEGLAPLRYQRPTPKDAARTLVISILGQRLAQQARRAGLRTSDHFRGITLGTGFTTTTLLRELSHLPAGFTELMVHPGYLDAEQAEYTAFTTGRDRELAALTAPTVSTRLAESGAQLVRWDRSAGGPAPSSVRPAAPP